MQCIDTSWKVGPQAPWHVTFSAESHKKVTINLLMIMSSRNSYLRIILTLVAANVVAMRLPAADDVPVVVKIAGIPWFSAMEKGIAEAAKETGLNAYMVGPTTADPAQQVRLVEDLVAKKVKLIAVVPNDAKALEPVFKRAQAAGVPIIKIGRAHV